MHRDDEVDDGVHPGRRKAPALDGEPPVARHRADLVGVVLAVSAVVQRDPRHEALPSERKRDDHLVPGEGDRGGEPGMLELGEDHGSAVGPEHLRE